MAYHTHIHVFNIDDDDDLAALSAKLLEFHIQKRFLGISNYYQDGTSEDADRGVDVIQWKESVIVITTLKIFEVSVSSGLGLGGRCRE